MKKIFLFLLIPILLFSTNYYVDATSGDDANNGLTMATAFQTIDEVTDGAPVLAGDDIIYLRTDGVWRETLTVPTSGTSGHPITFTSYDSTGESGADPIIQASTVLSSFTAMPHLTTGTKTSSDGFEAADLSAWTTVSGAAQSTDQERDGAKSVLLDAQWDVFGRAPGVSTKEVYTSFSFYINEADWSDEKYIYRQDWIDNGSYFLFGVKDDTLWAKADAVDYKSALPVTYQGWVDLRIHILAAEAAGSCSLEVWSKVAAAESFTQIIDETALTWAELAPGDKYLAIEYFQMPEASMTVYIDDYRLSSVGFGSTIYRAANISYGIYDDDVVRPKRTYDTDPFITANTMSANEWFTDGATYSYLSLDPTAKVIDSALQYGIYLSGKNYVTIDGIEVQQFGQKGIYSYLSDGTTIQNTTISGGTDPTSTFGIQIQGAAGNNSTTGSILLNTIDTIGYTNQTAIHLNAGIDAEYTNGVIISNNNISPIYVSGITSRGYINNQSSGATIESNNINAYYGMGLTVTETAGTVLARYNHIYSGSGGGIALNYTIDGATIAYNLIHDLTKLAATFNGIDFNEDVINSFIYNNTVYAVGLGCVTLEDGCSGNTIKNNIFDSQLNNGGGAYCIYTVDGDSANSYDNNIYFTPDTGTYAGKVALVGAATKTFTEWKAILVGWSGTSKDGNSLETDPLMTDPANADFTLQALSPAIDAGVDVGVVLDYAGNIVPFNARSDRSPDFDIGAYEYQLVVSIDYENRHDNYLDYWKYKRY